MSHDDDFVSGADDLVRVLDFSAPSRAKTAKIAECAIAKGNHTAGFVLLPDDGIGKAMIVLNGEMYSVSLEDKRAVLEVAS